MAKTDWHLDLDVDRSDPFAADVRQAPRVDLRDPDLHLRLRELLTIESELSNRGMTCSLKERPGACCSACPLRGQPSVYPIRALCKLGLEQETTLMAVLAADA